MKLSWPFVSSTAHLTASIDSIWFWRAAASSSSVIRFRRRLRSIGFPSSTTITGSPSSTGRRRGKRARVRDDDRHQRDRRTDEQRARDGEVVLGHPLLDEVADHRAGSGRTAPSRARRPITRVSR